MPNRQLRVTVSSFESLEFYLFNLIIIILLFLEVNIFLWGMKKKHEYSPFPYAWKSFF